MQRIPIFAKTAAGLQNMLDILSVYSNNSGINVNIAKTKIMIFERRTSLMNTKQTFDGNELEMVI